MAHSLRVYFILAAGAGSVKIGKSYNPDHRLRELQTSHPETLEIILLLPHCAPFEEDQLHWRFRKYRQRGEWFEYRDEVRAFVDRKRRDPSPQPDDDRALAPIPETEESGLDGGAYAYPRHDKKKVRNPEGLDCGSVIDLQHDDRRPPMRSPAYGLGARWGARDSADDQNYWHEVQTGWSAREK